MLYKKLRKERPMLTPDITITSVGTEITYGNSMLPDDGWEGFLNNKWDRKIVTEETRKFPELTLQVQTFASFYIEMMVKNTPKLSLVPFSYVNYHHLRGSSGRKRKQQLIPIVILISSEM